MLTTATTDTALPIAIREHMGTKKTSIRRSKGFCRVFREMKTSLRAGKVETDDVNVVAEVQWPLVRSADDVGTPRHERHVHLFQRPFQFARFIVRQGQVSVEIHGETVAFWQ